MSLEAKTTSAACLAASEVISEKLKLENLILSQWGNLHFVATVQERALSKETQGQATAEQRGDLVISVY